MKKNIKQMLQKVVANTLASVALTIFLAVMIVVLLAKMFNISVNIDGIALVLGLLGTTLAFTGNNLTLDALGRYDPQDLPQWKWGNRLQSIGFALTIAALLVNGQ